MAIQGQRSEAPVKKLYTGLADFVVLGFNPTAEQIKEWTGYERREEPEYLVEDRDGTPQLRLDIYVKERTTGFVTNLSYYLQDALRAPGKGSGKVEQINSQGRTTWVDENNPTYFEWYSQEGIRRTHIGEANLYTFLHAWLNFNTNTSDFEFQLDTAWSDLCGGDVAELNALVTDNPSHVRLLCGVRETEKGSYQSVYAYRPLVTRDGFGDSAPKTVQKLEEEITGEYGWKDNWQGDFNFKEYDASYSSANIVSQPTQTVTASDAEVESYMSNV